MITEANMDVDNKKRSFKVITILLVMFIINLCVNTGCHRTREPELHILPDGYIGKVYILFNVTGNEKLTYESKARVYDIPSSGILLTRSSKNTGFIDANKHINFRYKNSEEYINKFIVSDSLNLQLDSLAITVFDFGYGGMTNFHLKYSCLTYTVDTFKNSSKKDTFILRKSLLQNHYPDLDI